MSEVPELINQLYHAKIAADAAWFDCRNLRQAAGEAEKKWLSAQASVDQIEQKIREAEIRDTETASLPINKNL